MTQPAKKLTQPRELGSKSCTELNIALPAFAEQ